MTMNYDAIVGKIREVAASVLKIRFGTVTSDLNTKSTQTQVKLDSDPETPVTAISLSGRYAANTRVACLLYPPRGLLILGAIADSVEGTGICSAVGALRVLSDDDVSATSSCAGIEVVSEANNRAVKIDFNEVSAFDITPGAEDEAALFLNPDGGRVAINNTAAGGPNNGLLIPNGNATSLSEQNPYLQVGTFSGDNIALGPDGVQARNNGAGSTLFLNYYGDNIRCFQGDPGVNQMRIDGHLKWDTIAVGSATVNPTANVISSTTVTGAGLDSGYTYRGVVSASSTVPGESGVAGQVYEVTSSGHTNDGLTVYLLRGNATSTGIHYILLSDDI